MRYTVKHHTEEFECPCCGAPVYVGDRAGLLDEVAYCGECHKAALAQRGAQTSKYRAHDDPTGVDQL